MDFLRTLRSKLEVVFGKRIRKKELYPWSRFLFIDKGKETNMPLRKPYRLGRFFEHEGFITNWAKEIGRENIVG